MDHRRASAAESASCSSVYSTQTLPVPVPAAPLPIGESARTSQTSFASRAWIFGKVPDYTSTSTTNPNPNPNFNGNSNSNSTERHQRQRRRRRPSHLEPVALRDSVAYPSASSFEATIEKGTALCGRRSAAKPRLVDLGGLRRKVKRMTTTTMTTMRRGSEQRGATLREAFGGGAAGGDAAREREMAQVREQSQDQDQMRIRGGERRPEDEDVRFGPPTDRQLATMLYHETQNDIMIRTRTESPTTRVPEMPFRDKIRGKYFSRTAGNLEEEVSSYAKEKRRGCATAQCVVI